MQNLKTVLLNSPLRPLWDAWKRVFSVDRKRNAAYFRYDGERYWRHSGAWCEGGSMEARIARLALSYHVIEKGLTMPARRLGFGVQAVKELIGQIDSFERKFGRDVQTLRHAIGVVKRYAAVHEEAGFRFPENPEMPAMLSDFAGRHADVASADEPHLRRVEFYAAKDAPFPEFAKARHTLRHFAPGVEVSMAKIERAVALAQTAPSACNRQHARVLCVCGSEKCGKVLALQGGSRGFGHLADKVLVVAADMRDALLPRERNDVYVNGGIFLMNLCYALYHEEVAHCILTWAQNPETDRELRRLVPLDGAETVVALVACGEAPDEFDVAASPRRPSGEVLKVV